MTQDSRSSRTSVSDWYSEHTEAELLQRYREATGPDAPDHMRGESFEKWAEAEGYVRGSGVSEDERLKRISTKVSTPIKRLADHRPPEDTQKMDKPSSIYLWIVPSEEVLEQPGSWRIRKWNIEPFPEATHIACSSDGVEAPAMQDIRDYRNCVAPPCPNTDGCTLTGCRTERYAAPQGHDATAKADLLRVAEILRNYASVTEEFLTKVDYLPVIRDAAERAESAAKSLGGSRPTAFAHPYKDIVKLLHETAGYLRLEHFHRNDERMTWRHEALDNAAFSIAAEQRELLAIHDACMNPEEIVIENSDTFTVKMVKEFILKFLEYKAVVELAEAWGKKP